MAVAPAPAATAPLLLASLIALSALSFLLQSRLVKLNLPALLLPVLARFALAFILSRALRRWYLRPTGTDAREGWERIGMLEEHEKDGVEDTGRFVDRSSASPTNSPVDHSTSYPLLSTPGSTPRIALTTSAPPSWLSRTTVIAALCLAASALLSSYSYGRARSFTVPPGTPSIAQALSISTEPLAIVVVLLLTSTSHERFHTFVGLVLLGLGVLLVRLGAIGTREEWKLVEAVLERTTAVALGAVGSILVSHQLRGSANSDLTRSSMLRTFEGHMLIAGAVAALAVTVSPFLARHPFPALSVWLPTALAYSVVAAVADLTLFSLLTRVSPLNVATGTSIAALLFTVGFRLFFPSQHPSPIASFGFPESIATLLAVAGLAAMLVLSSRYDTDGERELTGILRVLVGWSWSADAVAPHLDHSHSPHPAHPLPYAATPARGRTSSPYGVALRLVPGRPTLVLLSMAGLYLATVLLPHLTAPARTISSTLTTSVTLPYQSLTHNISPSLRRPSPHTLPPLPYGLDPAILGQGVPFIDFLRPRIDKTKNKVIWLTVADEAYAKRAVRHLALFMDGINFGKPTYEREELVVLCLDEGCVDECNLRGEFAYAGFSYTVDKTMQTSNEFIQAAIWVKLNGIIESLQAGYAVVFADGDVFLRRDPRPNMLPLTVETWDLQIQDEGHERNVNIGFFFMRASTLAASFWQDVLREMYIPTPSGGGVWDQKVVNDLLQTSSRRLGPENHQPYANFLSPTGLQVHVLMALEFWGFHLGWLLFEETSILHMTCADSLYLKFYLAGAYSGWGDVNQYYTNPPKILVAPVLSGTREDMIATMRLVIATARFTGRAILPPLQGVYIGPPSPDDGNSAERPTNATLIAHQRFIWSLFPLERIEKQFGVIFLEPNYIEHATKHLAGIRPDLVAELHDYAEFDMRPVSSFGYQKDRITSPLFRDKLVVRLTTDEGPRGRWSRYGDWDLDGLEPVDMCEQIEKVSQCASLCRLSPTY